MIIPIDNLIGYRSSSSAFASSAPLTPARSRAIFQYGIFNTQAYFVPRNTIDKIGPAAPRVIIEIPFISIRLRDALALVFLRPGRNELLPPSGREDGKRRRRALPPKAYESMT